MVYLWGPGLRRTSLQRSTHSSKYVLIRILSDAILDYQIKSKTFKHMHLVIEMYFDGTITEVCVCVCVSGRSPARSPAAATSFNCSTDDLRSRHGGSYGRLRTSTFYQDQFLKMTCRSIWNATQSRLFRFGNWFWASRSNLAGVQWVQLLFCPWHFNSTDAQVKSCV